MFKEIDFKYFYITVNLTLIKRNYFYFKKKERKEINIVVWYTVWNGNDKVEINIYWLTNYT